MNDNASLIKALPERIVGEVELCSIRPSAWRWVQSLDIREQEMMADSLNFRENQNLGFANKTAYENLCIQFLMQEETPPFRQPATRHYLICSSPEKQAVGYIGVYSPHDQPDIAAIFYGTMPHFQRKGYASTAASAITNHMMESRLAHSVDAYISAGNAASVKVLQPLGFQQIGNGLCELETGHYLPMRQYRKTQSAAKTTLEHPRPK